MPGARTYRPADHAPGVAVVSVVTVEEPWEEAGAETRPSARR